MHKFLMFFGLYMLCMLCALIAYNQQVEKIKLENPFDLSKLAKAEENFWKKKRARRYEDNRSIRGGAAAKKFNYDASLARADVSEFFKTKHPLNLPNIPKTYLLTWAGLAVSDVMTFGFNDYGPRLNLSSAYFTDHGWDSFSEAMTRSRMLEMIHVNQQIITAALQGAPALNSGNVNHDRYEWVVQLPLVLTYRSGARSSNASMLVTVVIVRSDDPKHPYGIAIDQWIAESR